MFYYSYFKSQWAMPINRNFEFYELFNYQILKIKESGNLRFIQHSYEMESNKCGTSSNQKGSPIDLYTIILAVLVYIGGLGASVLILILENCWKFSRKTKEREHIMEQYSTTAEVRNRSQLSVHSVE